MEHLQDLFKSSILSIKSSFFAEREGRGFLLLSEGEEDPVFRRIKRSFSQVSAVELVGRRKTGKSLFLLELLAKNNHLFPFLIITKGDFPPVNCPVQAAHTIDGFISAVYSVISGIPKYPTDLLCVDTLSTLLYTEEGVRRKEEVYLALQQLLALGTRILCISSTIHSTPRTSSFFSASILFK